jgi:hypothetical protein
MQILTPSSLQFVSGPIRREAAKFHGKMGFKSGSSAPVDCCNSWKRLDPTNRAHCLQRLHWIIHVGLDSESTRQKRNGRDGPPVDSLWSTPPLLTSSVDYDLPNDDADTDLAAPCIWLIGWCFRCSMPFHFECNYSHHYFFLSYQDLSFKKLQRKWTGKRIQINERLPLCSTVSVKRFQQLVRLILLLY